MQRPDKQQTMLMATLSQTQTGSLKGSILFPRGQPPPPISTDSEGTPTALAFSILNPEGDIGASHMTTFVLSTIDYGVVGQGQKPRKWLNAKAERM